MAFEGLSAKLKSAFKKLRSKGKLSEKDVKDAMREVRIALLEADVNYKIAKEFTDKLTERAIGTEVMTSLTPAQMVIKIVNEELTSLMGETRSRLNISAIPPTIVMMCGLQGSGKTTHSAKLALWESRKGHRPLLVACDIYRPAAIKQLQVIAEKIKMPVFEMGTENPVKIAKESVKYAKDHGNDLIILDTAGRLHIDQELMDELKNINAEVKPHEILLVVDSMTGQDAVNVAKAFDDTLSLTGVILTKLDGDARGGAALSVRKVTNKPIKYIGVGEKLTDLEEFHPARMASRILGMGDILTFIEQAELMDQQSLNKINSNVLKNNYDLDDLLNQFEQIKKMGSFKTLLSKIPGISEAVLAENFTDKNFNKLCAIIRSMTKKERKKPDILNASRKKRIAKGSGTRVEDVNNLLKRFEQMKLILKKFGKYKSKKLLPKIPGFPDLNMFKKFKV